MDEIIKKRLEEKTRRKEPNKTIETTKSKE
jgi:hypothetical protein